MSGNNRGEAETQYRNNNIDTYQIQFRSNSEGPIDDKKDHEIDVETRTSIPIQTGDIYRQKIRRITKNRDESS